MIGSFLVIYIKFDGKKTQAVKGLLLYYNHRATEALYRELLPGFRVVEARDLSLLRARVDIQCIPGTINEKREALERMALEVLNPHQAFVLLKNAFAIPKLQYVLRASPTYFCREELRISTGLFLVL